MKPRIIRPDETHNMVLPRIGHIKTGRVVEKKIGGVMKEIPESLDYFVATGPYASYFMKAYSDKPPSTIQIVFFDDDPLKSCHEKYEYRLNDGRLHARGDGEEFEVWNGKTYDTFFIKDHPDLMDRVEKKTPSPHGWKVTLTLRFIIPAVKGIAGYWEYNTRGDKSTIPNVAGTFHSILENRGFVKGIIFDLNVEFAKSQKPGVKSRYPVVTLVANMSEENVKLVKESLVSFDQEIDQISGGETKQLEK